MDERVRGQIDELISKCRQLSSLGYTVEDKNSDPADFMKFTLTKMLIYISMSDKEAHPAEAEFINEALGLNITESDVAKFAGDKTITANEVTDGLQKLCVPFAKAQVDGRLDYDCTRIVSFINTIGISLIAADGNADERQTAILSSLTFRLRIFCDSYVKSLKEKKAKGGSVPKAAADVKKTEEKSSDETLEELMDKLNSLIGLENVKSEIHSLSNLIKVRKLREERGFKQPDMSLHLVFTGNPGTGKTTVARLISKIYNRLGVLPTDKLVEVDRSGLVSGYVGKTALKTKEVCESALGGVLFIDEAYALTNTESKNDFGSEAVNTLLKFMEDHRSELVLICAGYTELMEEFLTSNPGLKSRFNRFIHFDDYSAEELTAIFVSLCKGYKLEVDFDALSHVKSFFELRKSEQLEHFANGRDVRNFFERVLSNQADRLSEMEEITDEQLVKITLSDVSGILL